MEVLARGSRKRSQLRSHAGPVDEFTAEALGVAGTPRDRLGTRIVQKQDSLHSKLEREDGGRRDHWFDKRFRMEAWKILRLVFLKRPDAELEKELRGFRAIALLSVFSIWYTTILENLLHDEEETIEWRSICT